MKLDVPGSANYIPDRFGLRWISLQRTSELRRFRGNVPLPETADARP